MFPQHPLYGELDSLVKAWPGHLSANTRKRAVFFVFGILLAGTVVVRVIATRQTNLIFEPQRTQRTSKTTRLSAFMPHAQSLCPLCPLRFFAGLIADRYHAFPEPGITRRNRAGWTRKIFNASSHLLHIYPLWLEQRTDRTRERRAGAINRREP